MTNIKTEEQVRYELLRMCEGTTQTAVAKRLGVTKQFFGDLITGQRRISKRIAKQLGYRIEKIPATYHYHKINS